MPIDSSIDNTLRKLNPIIPISSFLLTCLCFGLLLRQQIGFVSAFYDNAQVEYLAFGMILLISFYGTNTIIRNRERLPFWTLIATLALFSLTVTVGEEFLLWSIGLSSFGGLLSYFYIGLASVLGALIWFEVEKHLAKMANQWALWTTGVLLCLLGSILNGLLPPLGILSIVIVHFITGSLLPAQYNLSPKARLAAVLLGCGILISPSFISAKNIHIAKGQKKYFDRVVFSTHTKLQAIEVTVWKGNHWFYRNRINQFSSIDKWMYFEPLVHPAVKLTDQRQRVLVFGGENGCALHELTQYKDIEQVDLIPFDCELVDIAKTNHLFVKENGGAFNDPRVHTTCQDPFLFLNQGKAPYDIILIDLPDPTDIELNQYYTKEFYELCLRNLKDGGVMVTQAGSPYFATKAYHGIGHTMQQAGIEVVPYHNQVPTLGEWGWFIGVKGQTTKDSYGKLSNMDFSKTNTTWLNQDAMRMMLSFGKPYVAVDDIQTNTLTHPVIHRYYTTGNWKF